jgi:hypothetical protein
MEAELFSHFERLRNAIFTFSRSIEQQNQSYWLADWNITSKVTSIEECLLDLWYHEDQDGRETRIYPGLIGLSREQITFANEINLLKDQFRLLVQNIKEHDNNNWREIQGKLALRYRVLNDSLAREGLNRLHLKQVFRHIPLVLTRPEKVGFSWYTSGRSIKKISKKESYDLLCKLNTESAHIRIQIERLSSIQDSEPLARVQKQAPVLRANIVNSDKSRRSLNVSLPLMYPNEGRNQLPDFNVPIKTPPNERQRLVRSDNKIEDEAFLPSIRVHRYTQKKSGFAY